MHLSTTALVGVVFALAVSAAPAPQSGTDYTCDGTTAWHNSYQTVTCQGGTVCATGASGNPCVWPSGYGVADVAVATTSAAGAATSAAASIGASSEVTSAAATSGAASSAATSATVTTAKSSALSNAAVSASTSASASVASGSASASGSSSATSTGASSASATNGAGIRYVAYWSNYDNLNSVPTADQLSGVTHLILAFADMTTWTSFVESSIGNFDAEQIATIRSTVPGIKVMVALGGWGLDTPIKKAADGGTSTIKTFAENAKGFVKQYALDGIDIDWEYPTASEGSALVELAAALKSALKELGDDKLLSVALPSRVDYNTAGGDAAAYTSDILSKLDDSVDMYNLMTYDYTNRYDTKTGHQAGGAVVTAAMKWYSSQNIPSDKVNVGFPTYAKYFVIPSNDTSACSSETIGCPMGPYPDASADKSGWLTYNPDIDATLGTDNGAAVANFRSTSWANRPTDDSTNYADAVAHAWYDSTNTVFWTWLEADDIKSVCNTWKSKVGGMMVWSLNQDTNGGSGGEHIAALGSCLSSK